jgi:Spb1 C-terminal domain
MLRAKQRALDARPIKKVAEAKARKKMRAVQRFEKAVKKAEGVNQNTDMSERDKAGAIEKLIRKGMSSEKKKKSEVKIVVAKGAAKGVKGRPKGVKGRYQMVDARGRKEVCGAPQFGFFWLRFSPFVTRSCGPKSGARKRIRSGNELKFWQYIRTCFSFLVMFGKYIMHHLQ